MREVKTFFEQDAYVNHPEQVRAYVSWVLQPDGPAFHETPTCNFKCDHQEYIVSPHSSSHADSQPLALAPKRHISITHHEQCRKALSPSSKGLGSWSANQCLATAEGTLWASARFRMLFAFFYSTLTEGKQVERAFTAFESGDYKKPKAKFSHKNYQSQLETYMGHLDTVQPALWEQILYGVKTSDVHDNLQSDFADDSSIMFINRQNLYIPRITDLEWESINGKAILFYIAFSFFF